ncbi:hypothetical protein P7B02_02705 [Caulobacter segnis]|nr:hypothetical protein [Caulobacter segnis]MDG2520438.1 hypothetical protein [Caulobacter segnis]
MTRALTVWWDNTTGGFDSAALRGHVAVITARARMVLGLDQIEAEA